MIPLEHVGAAMADPAIRHEDEVRALFGSARAARLNFD